VVHDASPIISSLVDVTLHTLDDMLRPAANWVLKLQDQMKSSLNLSYSYENIMKFQNEIVTLKIYKIVSALKTL